MSDFLTIDEIRTRYGSEWILIGDPEVDDALEVVRGRVLFHSPDSEAVYRRATELRPGRFATIYTGAIPEDLEFAL